MMTSESISMCPLCHHEEAVFHSIPLSNLYSEKMAEVSGEKESDLLAYFSNVSCTQCGLVYKKQAYPKALIGEIFHDVVPEHPKGWDVMLGRFTTHNFFTELALYAEAIRLQDIAGMNRYRRALLSIIDSIYPHEPNQGLKNACIQHIESQNIHALTALKTELEQAIQEPMPFKRFSGFSSPRLWHYLVEKLGPIQTYDEVGCPLWGLLAYAKSQGVDARFVQRPEFNYWGENCKKDRVNCIDWLNKEHQVELSQWHEGQPASKRQLLGFFQYLDHLEDPSAFLETVFNQYEAAAIILDGVNEPVYIQHITGWTDQAIAYVAHRFNKQVHTDFHLIEPSGNRLFLFQ